LLYGREQIKQRKIKSTIKEGIKEGRTEGRNKRTEESNLNIKLNYI
jgi:hypothetical protein